MSKNTETPLLIEQTQPGRRTVTLSGTDVKVNPPADTIPPELLAESPPELPQLGELQLIRHYSHLSKRTFSVDGEFYPLGSCTMKYNPRINETLAALPGFTHLHPCQPDDDVQGALELLYELQQYLAEIAGLDAVSLQPAAGAHGEFTAMAMIAAYHRDRKEERTTALIPDSAHGTNPASCTLCGLTTLPVKSRPDGQVDMEDLASKIDEKTAAMMITNPNTLGLFERQIGRIAEMLHDKGALLYMDGANMNALMGLVRPGDTGVDVMHFNPHKTFSTPHGGGGPGAGPIAVRKTLQGFLPTPIVEKNEHKYCWKKDLPKSIGRVRSFNSQFLVLVRAYAYLRCLGRSGVKAVTEAAILNANYLAHQLKDHFSAPYPDGCLHEFVLSGQLLKAQHGVTTLDVAKRLLDFGIHPPTIYFPLIVPECLMIEPTETESPEDLARFAEVMIRIVHEAETDPETLKSSPHHLPVARINEVAAARNPVLTWAMGK